MAKEREEGEVGREGSPVLLWTRTLQFWIIIIFMRNSLEKQLRTDADYNINLKVKSHINVSENHLGKVRYKPLNKTPKVKDQSAR